MHLFIFSFAALLPLLLTLESHAVILIFSLVWLVYEVFSRGSIPRVFLALIPFFTAVITAGLLAGKSSLWSSTYVAFQSLSWLMFGIVMARNSHVSWFVKGLFIGVQLFVVGNLLAIYVDPLGVRHSGLFPNANGLAAASACLLVIVHALQGHLHFSRKNLVYGLRVGALAGLGLVLILSGSRAGLFASVLYFGAYGIFSVRKAIRGLASVILIAPLVYLLGGDFVRNALIFKRIESVFVEMVSGGGSRNLESLEVAERVNLADIGIQRWKDSPIIGNGVGAYRDHSGYAYAHNAYVDLLFSAGTLEMLAYLFFLASLLFGYVRFYKDRNGADGFFSIFLFLMFYSLFIPTYQILPFALVFGYLAHFSMTRVERLKHD